MIHKSKDSIRQLALNWRYINANNSIVTGEFSQPWKECIVTPIEKVSNTNKSEEFRPINTLKTWEKYLK